jgi:hypothetical protein
LREKLRQSPCDKSAQSHADILAHVSLSRKNVLRLRKQLPPRPLTGLHWPARQNIRPVFFWQRTLSGDALP